MKQRTTEDRLLTADVDCDEKATALVHSFARFFEDHARRLKLREKVTANFMKD